MSGKGDRYRPVDQKKWDENYTRIFGSKPERNQNGSTNDQRQRTEAKVQ